MFEIVVSLIYDLIDIIPGIFVIFLMCIMINKFIK